MKYAVIHKTFSGITYFNNRVKISFAVMLEHNECVSSIEYRLEEADPYKYIDYSFEVDDEVPLNITDNTCVVQVDYDGPSVEHAIEMMNQIATVDPNVLLGRTIGNGLQVIIAEDSVSLRDWNTGYVASDGETLDYQNELFEFCNGRAVYYRGKDGIEGMERGLKDMGFDVIKDNYLRDIMKERNSHIH